METEIIKISKNQYLKDIIPELETNRIYFKTLPNIGATTAELLAKRHSLVFEANVPVIKGKKTKGILGVYEGVTIDRIIEYLASGVKFKKIITTPESFFKIKEAAKYLGINLYQEFFFFFDECDRIIKDSGYRTGITLPMDDFFKFKNKAFVSATALEPSDPRFEEQVFSKVVVMPDFSYQKDIQLFTTNNVLFTLKKVLTEVKSSNYCIFLNSTNLISAYIKKLGLKDSSSIYCSKDRGYALKINKFKKVYDSLQDFSEHNFFTSRFYSAVDIMMEEPPTIIMVSDIVTASHSMIDPYTDAVQIVGRFRKGVEKIIHIANLNPQLGAMSEEEMAGYLAGCEFSYAQIKALRLGATSDGAKDSLDEALRLIPYAKYLNENGSKNYYVWDNSVYEEKIKHHYLSQENFIAAYSNEHFKPLHTDEEYPLDDMGSQKLRSGISISTIVAQIIETLAWIADTSTHYTIDNRNTVLAELLKGFPFLMDAYKKLGPEELAKNGYSINQIKRAIKQKVKFAEKSNFEFVKSIQENFEVGQDWSSKDCKNTLNQIIADHKLSLRADIKLLEEYFDLSPRKTIKRFSDGTEIKGFSIRRSKFNS